MGFKSKFLLMLIIYFAGFATAVYYLSPNGRAGPASADASSYSDDQGQGRTVEALTSLRDKTYDKVAAGVAAMNQEDFKAAFDRYLEAVKNMVKGSHGAKAPEGGEDK